MDGSVAGVYLPDRRTRWSRPLILCHVSAGFPSPAEDYVDYVESRFNDYLLTGSNSTGNSLRTSLFNSRGVGPAGVGISSSCA
jgi:hypothetical protein